MIRSPWEDTFHGTPFPFGAGAPMLSFPSAQRPQVSYIFPVLGCISSSLISLENSWTGFSRVANDALGLFESLEIRSNLCPMCSFAVYLVPLKCKSLLPAFGENWMPSLLRSLLHATGSRPLRLLPKIKGALCTKSHHPKT